LQAFDLSGRLAGGKLILNFAKSGIVDVFHRGTAVADAFWLWETASRAKYSKELRGLAIDFAEDFQFLENQRPGKNGEG
jgi:hypothetical protein